MTMDWEHAGNPDPAAAERRRRAWRTVGIVLAVVVAIAGLALVAVVVMTVIALNSFGSNK